MKYLLNRIFVTLLLIFTVLAASASSLDAELLPIQERWAAINYQVTSEDQQSEQFSALENDLQQLVARYPGQAEPLIWHGIVLSTHAGVSGGLGALKMVKQAKKLFEQAIEMDDSALDGSAHTSLGSLYYQVPAWPIAFGSDKKAERELQYALTINPDGIDPNYFMGDFLYEQGRYAEAQDALKVALTAPDRTNRPIADQGRRGEIQKLLNAVNEALNQ